MVYILKVLCIGLSPDTPSVTDDQRPGIVKRLQEMDDQMKATPYDWTFVFHEPGEQFEAVIETLKQRRWDVVLLGATLRKLDDITWCFEEIVNAIRVMAPQAKLASPENIERTMQALQRQWPLENVA